MDSIIKQSIDSRKQAIYNMYNVTDTMNSKIEDLFKRMEELGNTCSDSMDFETKLAASPLNQEYINLFTELSTTCSMKTIETEASDQEYVEENNTNELKEAALDITRPVRRKVNSEVYDKVRDVPGVASVLSAKQHIDFFGRFKRKKEVSDEK